MPRWILLLGGFALCGLWVGTMLYARRLGLNLDIETKGRPIRPLEGILGLLAVFVGLCGLLGALGALFGPPTVRSREGVLDEEWRPWRWRLHDRLGGMNVLAGTFVGMGAAVVIGLVWLLVFGSWTQRLAAIGAALIPVLVRFAVKRT